jgi:hypothetical protein
MHAKLRVLQQATSRAIVKIWSALRSPKGSKGPSVNCMSAVISASWVRRAQENQSGVLFWDVSANGKRFLMANPSTEGASAQKKFTIVLNWQTALKQ